ncbi:MAG: diguanylate cyclase [Chloroflexi bacterium]|nr:diguanylate cyclase [Chloroflexota bacterium]
MKVMAFTAGLWIFVPAALILAGLMISTWQFRDSDTGKAFLLLAGSALLWVAGFIFETAARSLPSKLFFANLQFLGLCFIPLVWLYLAVSYRGWTRPARDWFLPASVPLMTNLVIWTDPLHHWFRGAPHIDSTSAPFPVLVNDYQFWFYFIHAPWGYVCILAAVLILLYGFRKMLPIYRKQTLLLLAALSLPMVVDVTYVLGYSPIQSYNLTPAVFSLSAILVAWDLFRFQLFDLRPIARHLVMESIQEGILVLDQQERIIDLNPAAERMARITAASIGKDLQEMQAWLHQVIHDLDREGKSWTEIQVGENPVLTYELHFSAIEHPSGRPIGRIITLRDNTERAELFHRIEHAATHDDLTGTLNRQRFAELATQEFQRPGRAEHHRVSMIMFDLDRFKQINDQYGHATGDEALIKVAQACPRLLRPSDIFGRIGGDEFAVILPDTSADDTARAAERLREGIEKLEFLAEGQHVWLTSSFGIYTLQNGNEPFNEVFKRVDKAMYRAKQSGGNRVVNFESLAENAPRMDN